MRLTAGRTFGNVAATVSQDGLLGASTAEKDGPRTVQRGATHSNKQAGCIERRGGGRHLLADILLEQLLRTCVARIPGL